MVRRERPTTGGRSSKKPKPKPLLSPLPVDSPARPIPIPFDFDLNGLTTSTKKTTSPLLPKTPSSIASVRDLAFSRTDAIKRSLDACHSEILKEFDASKTRISKRLKMQTQACTQIADEADKEFKKISDRITENTELVKSSYSEFISEAQASASRVCKVSINELAQSLEKAVGDMRNRYKIPSTPVTSIV